MSSPPTPPARPRSRSTLLVLLVGGVVLALVVAGGLGAFLLLGRDDPGSRPASEAADPPAQADPLPETDAALATYYDQELTWKDCRGGECATLSVPLDYAEPDGDSIDIAVLRVPARDRAKRVGQLVLNPGGPGASGVDFARAGSLVTGTEIARVYDLVGFDPRGVGASSAVSCGPTELLDAKVASDPDPDSAAEVEEVRGIAREFADACVEDTGPLIEHVSTVEAARDMDVLRAALGEPDLDYLGFSYGTQLGSTYAELFPDHVGRMVLDAAVTPETDPVDLSRGQLEGFQTALEAYLADCVKSGSCPLGDSVDEAQQRLVDLLDDIDAKPLPTADDRELTEGRAMYGLFQPLYARQLWPALTQALKAAMKGNGAALGFLSDQYQQRGPNGYTSNLSEAFAAIGCLDVGPDPVEADPADYVDEFERISPVFGRTFALSLYGCTDWPVKPTLTLPTPVAKGAPPIIVIGTTRDPATPLAWAVALSDSLSSAVLITRDGDGHAGFQKGNQCVDSAVIGFFLDGKAPAKNLSC